MAKRLFMVAGEASADMHAATLLTELKKHYPNLNCIGVGGPALRRVGMDVLLGSEKLNVVGISDWWDRFAEVLGGYRKVIRYLEKNPPDLAVLLDLPDFNLRVAKKLKKLGVPVVYYISPQVWAWRKYRIHQIKRDVNLMLVVFPFEKDFYAKEGVDVVFVGHPLLESIHPKTGQRPQLEISKAPKIALLPGSRKSEIRFHSPILSDLVDLLRNKYPDAEIRVPVAQTLSKDFVQQSFGRPDITFIDSNSHDVLNWADVAVVASGTATLETALIGTPFSLFYRVSKISSWVFRKLTKYRGFIGMPNLLQGREVVREFFQAQASAQALFVETDKLIQNEIYRNEQVSALLNCRLKLGDTGANVRAAENIHQFLLKKN
jgi:lipid-A-disaccharide synthase